MIITIVAGWRLVNRRIANARRGIGFTVPNNNPRGNTKPTPPDIIRLAKRQTHPTSDVASPLTDRFFLLSYR